MYVVLQDARLKIYRLHTIGVANRLSGTTVVDIKVHQGVVAKLKVEVVAL